MTPLEFQTGFRAARDQVQRVIVGLDDIVDGVLTALFADGNVLLEGLPGLGKTRLVNALAASLDLSATRIQFTPDLMPADVTGTHLVSTDDAGRKHFSLRRGPIFANVVLADEINRATPKTQSALLEAMQERQVTLLGETHALPRPFIVVATQNPLEMEGTYPLPEAQLDRFLMKLHLEMPGEEALLTILERTTGTGEPEPDAALDAATILAMRECVREVPAAPETLRLAVRILMATQPDNDLAPDGVRRFVRFGASPRGVQALVLAGKCRALVERGDSRQPVLSPEDLEAVAVNCLRHRVILNFEGESERIDADALVVEAVQSARASLQGR
ncbi:MAG: AAA domain-containing protein [Proteobacteria bacterium]|nr:AAA domain-containing protein [Pseudomonadota bacterium]MCP4918879.1 AAA domain-containing protein [Pseudomonadota bacterium]